MEKEKLTQLVTEMQKGDQEAASELYLACRDDLYYYILKTVNDPHLAEDLLQDTFMEILQTIDKLNAPEAFVTWSRQIAYHRCTGYFRKRHELLADENEEGQTVFDTLEEDREEFIPDAAMDKEDLKATIAEMISQLPEEQRSTLILRYYDELSLEDIAKIQNIPLGTVKSRLTYSRKTLKATVEAYEKKNGIKLHSVAILPLLLWFFREKAISEGASLAAKGTAAAATAASGTAATTTATAGTTAAAGTAKAAAVTGAKAVATAGAKTAAKGIATKIIAGVLAASLVAGGAVVALNIINGNDESYDTSQDDDGDDSKTDKDSADKTQNGENNGTSEDPQQTGPQVSFPTQEDSLVVNMNDYLTVDFDGRDGRGYASCRYDDYLLLVDVYPFIVGMYTEYTVSNTLEGDDNHQFPVFTPVDDGKALTNGDTVHIHWEVNERGLMLLKQQLPNVEFKFEDTEVTVEGLEGVITIDPFNVERGAHVNCTIENSSISGQAILSDWRFSIRRQGDDTYSDVNITVDEMGHQGYWSNGDQIKITINETDEYLLEEFGVILTTKTGIVTIDWLDEPTQE